MVQQVLETVVGKLTGPDALLYLAIPATTGLIGWITNIVALKMTFRPIEFWGIPPYLGWQGILPRKAVKIARQFSGLLTENLISIEDLFEKIDPEIVARELEPAFDDLIEPTLRNSVAETSPPLWSVLPDWGKRQIHNYFRERLPDILDDVPGEVDSSLETASPEAVRKALDESDVSLETIIDEMMEERSPSVWEFLPNELQNMVILEIKNNLPDILSRVIDDWKRNIDDIFDLETMVVNETSQHPEILNDVFQKSGSEELTFIKRSGLYFGTFFGLFQMIFWMFFQPWWLLPLVGFFVGVATNYIAIQLIFSPKEPYNFGLFTLQGFAYKRRKEINETFSQIVSGEILNVDNTFDHIFRGPGRDHVFRILQQHIHTTMDTVGGPLNPIISRVIGPDRYFEMKNDIVEEMMTVLPETLEYSHEYFEDELQFETVLRENLDELPPREYETIMRTPYKEDEWILILVGGVLGFAAGILQLVYLFGGSIPLL